MINIDRRAALKCAVVLMLAFAFEQSMRGQDSGITSSAITVATAVDPQSVSGNVPHLIKISGVVTEPDGKPATGTVPMTFTLYSEQEGEALWTETQSAPVDSQ